MGFDNLFDEQGVDCVEKAYLLGLLTRENAITETGCKIYVGKNDIDVLDIFNKLFFGDVFIERVKNGYFLSVNSLVLCERVKDIFKLDGNHIRFPEMEDKYMYYFVRGVFESNGYIKYAKNPMCMMMHYSGKFLDEIVKRCDLKSIIERKENGKSVLKLYGSMALDFLNKVYKDVVIKDEVFYMTRTYNFYKRLIGWVPNVKMDNLYFKYIKTDVNAQAPYKQRASDSGYDLTLLKKIKTNGNVEFYDTCIKVEPMFGYYFDLVGRSSISKSGYMLANNVGIIDRTYQGSIIVPLIKMDVNKPDLELPCRLVQIIPRQIHHLEPIEIKEEELSLSDRNVGGFGSTN